MELIVDRQAWRSRVFDGKKEVQRVQHCEQRSFCQAFTQDSNMRSLAAVLADGG